MDWKFYLLFGGMWLVGIFIYSTFGTQIAIMRRCGKRLYYALYKERDSWDAEACRKYMERVKIRCLIIIAIATGLVYWLAGNCFWGYVCGVGFTWLISRGATECSATNVGEACKLFLRFAKFGKEDSVKARMEEILQKPEALAHVQRPDELPKPNWRKILLIVIAAVAALYGAWYFGVQCGGKAQTAPTAPIKATTAPTKAASSTNPTIPKAGTMVAPAGKTSASTKTGTAATKTTTSSDPAPSQGEGGGTDIAVSLLLTAGLVFCGWTVYQIRNGKETPGIGKEEIEKREALQKEMRKERWKRLLGGTWDIIKMVATWGISIALICWLVWALFGSGKSEKAEARPTETTSGYLYNADYEEGYERGHEAGEESAAEELTIDGVSIVDIDEKVLDRYGMSVSEAWGMVECYETEADHGGWSWAEYQNALEAVRYAASLFPVY